MIHPPRTREARRQDTLDRLARDVDVWVATADTSTGVPYLTPLSFLWEGGTLLLSTPAASPTGRNLRASGRVRLGLGLTRDVALIEGTVQETISAADMPAGLGDDFAAKTGFDPRAETGDYLYFCIRPSRIQAWREANELSGRDLMRDGVWL
jgi:hypothetical protein